MSDTELLAIDGVGKAKLENMAMLLKVIQDFQKQKVLKEKRSHNLETLELLKRIDC
jgi:ATP-dependent DNA helicase RecQ